MSNGRNILALAVVVITPLAYLWKYVHGSTGAGIPSFDIYSQAYPLAIQAVAAAADGGRGLLWNAMQNCGQPFFGTGITGVLYPGNLLFFVTDPDRALYALLGFNFLAASLSAYFLCRELGMTAVAACCGGLSFALGASSIDVNSATPLLSGPYVWFPLGMLFCERILRAPSVGNALGLAMVIAIALIPGHPQFVLYLLQIIGARFLWELATRPRRIGIATLAALFGGLVLGPLLIAVQFVPALEVARESIRGRALGMDEVSTGGFLTWAAIRNQLAWRWDNGQPFLVLPYMLGAAAVMYRPGRRILLFYALVAVLALDLAMGNNGFLFPLYAKLPFVTLFRNPNRMMIITSFCAALLAAAGLEAAVGSSSQPTWKTATAVGGLLLAGLIGMYWLIPNRLNPSEQWLGAIVLVAGTLGAARGGFRPAMGAVIIAALAFHLTYFRGPPLRQLLPDGGVLFARRPLFTALQGRMTAQDRIYLVPRQHDHSLQQKTGALFGVPAIFDYHSQISRRYADFFSMLRTGSPVRNFNQFAYALSGLLPRTLNHRLLSLAAGRYLVVPASTDANIDALRSMVLDTELSDGEVHVYQNPGALPRAFWVARVEVVEHAPALLERLAKGQDDLRHLALLESLPASGFVGAGEPASASTVAFLRNDPERVAVRVSAPARGFLFLSDQFFPGWHATVNDVPVPIERANYVFRLVEVPAGDSIVEFRYSPASVKLGAVISAGAWLVAGALLVHRYRRRSSRLASARCAPARAPDV